MTTITVIGAGSASFGENTLSAILRSNNLKGSTLRLVDRNVQSLDIVHRLANRLNKEWNAGFNISAHTHHNDALDGTKFVVSAIEVGPREELWKSDYELTLKHGVHQPYGENGGPGGFAHAARNIGPVMEIAHAMEQACPDAWIISIHDKRTGEDLYPLLRKRFFELEPSFEPLTRRVFQDFGLFPIPGDTHLCEYLSLVSDPVTKPWEKFNIRLYDWKTMASLRDFTLDRLNEMANGNLTIENLLETDSEGALEMIENITCAGTHYHLAANLPNVGQISNLPLGATVETPVIVDGAGIHPIHMGSLPEPVAELNRRELIVSKLCVDAVIDGSYEKALQCLLLDPMITDATTAKNILDDYLDTYKTHLPQFWRA